MKNNGGYKYNLNQILLILSRTQHFMRRKKLSIETQDHETSRYAVSIGLGTVQVLGNTC